MVKASRAELEETTEGEERLLFAQSYEALPIKMLGNSASAMKMTGKNSLHFRGTNMLSSSTAIMQFKSFFSHSGPSGSKRMSVVSGVVNVAYW